MRVMVMVKATTESEAGKLPERALLAAMGDMRTTRSRGRCRIRAPTKSNRCARNGAITGEPFRSAVWPGRSDCPRYSDGGS